MESEHRQNGIIRFSWRLAQQIMPEIKLNGLYVNGRLLAQEDLRVTGFFVELHKRLLLPESYEVIGIFFEHLRSCWDVLVYSPEIKEPKEGLYLPHVEPIYTCDMYGNNKKLVRMHIEYENSNDRVLRVD
jgi:hypothetical protein